MGTAIGKVIDRLVTALPTALQAIDGKVIVFDNWPTRRSGSWVVIGHQAYEDGEAGDVDVAWAALGAGRITETFTIPCFIDVFRDGPAQKPARDAAIALYDGVVRFIAADPYLGGALEHGHVALTSHLRLQQTQDSEDTGSGGLRRALISFQLACKSTYVP